MKRSEQKYNQCTAHDSTDWTRITWVLERKEERGGGRVGAKNPRATLINLQNKHSSTESRHRKQLNRRQLTLLAFHQICMKQVLEPHRIPLKQSPVNAEI